MDDQKVKAYSKIRNLQESNEYIRRNWTVLIIY